MTTNFYQILSVGRENALNKNSTIAEIKRAFRLLALKHHPDKGGDPEKFKYMLNAYEILSDKYKREIYDSSLASTQAERDNQEACDPNKDFSKKEGDIDALYFERSKLYSPFNLYFNEMHIKGHSLLSSRTLRSFEHHFSWFAQHKEKINNPAFSSFESRFRLMNESFTSFHSIDAVRKYAANIQVAYRDSRQVLSELYQPLRGLENLILALLMIVGLLVFTVIQLFSSLPGPRDGKLTSFYLSAIAHIITTTFTGLTQLVCTPLTWCIYMPIRAFNTLKDGWAVVEDGYHMKRIINEAYAGIEQQDKFTIITTISLLHKKFQKTHKDNQHCRKNNLELEGELYNEVDKDFILGTLNTKSSTPVTTEQKIHLLNYLSFFKAKAPVENQHSSSPNLDVML